MKMQQRNELIKFINKTINFKSAGFPQMEQIKFFSWHPLVKVNQEKNQTLICQNSPKSEFNHILDFNSSILTRSIRPIGFPLR